jgi:protein MpaA
VVRRRVVLAAVLVLAGCGLAAAHHRRPAAAKASVAPVRTVVIGRSVRHRPIRAVVVGDFRSRRRVLVVGCIHGSERAGIAITKALRRAAPPGDAALWLVDTANPDGCAAGTRQNAHGVDLNRNSPWRWQPLDHRGGLFWSGPRSLSEPESRAINRFVRRRRPAVSIWYHQHARLVDDAGGDRRIERHYAHMVGLPFRHLDGFFPGSITHWQNARFRHDTAFVVELPAGRLSRAAVRRHVRAVLSVAREGNRS